MPIPHHPPLEQCIFRVLQSNGSVAGAGFVLAEKLAVTCAHVLAKDQRQAGAIVTIQFPSSGTEQKVQVVEVHYDEAAKHQPLDIAFLALTELPEGVRPVVLGTALYRQGHDYRARGFPPLLDFKAREVNGAIGGDVPFGDGEKQRLLQLEREEIEEGMSGAPVLDTTTNRVVGMVREYIGGEKTPFAYAEMADTLVKLSPTPPKLWPDEYGPAEWAAYLDFLIEQNSTLTLPDGKRVPLERIYVSLRADQMNAAERGAEHALYLEEVEKEFRAMPGDTADPYQRSTAMRKAVQRHPIMKMLTVRDWEPMFGQRQDVSLNLAEVVQQHPQVVILGDPGSGKTTLTRWLVLQLATGMRQGKERVVVPTDKVQSNKKKEVNQPTSLPPLPRFGKDQLKKREKDKPQEIDLGVAHLPVLVRIGDYARARWAGDDREPELPLVEFISAGRHHSESLLSSYGLTHSLVGKMTVEAMAQGKVLLILDGLDEVGDTDQRRWVMQAVRQVMEPDKETKNQMTVVPPVILTSRVVGYQFQPLTHLPHFTVEDMDEEAITAFCQAWMKYVAEAGDKKAGDRLKKAIFTHGHPGVKALAGNPLLLTILAQVYQQGGGQPLPARRAALFREASKVLNQQLHDQKKAFRESPIPLKLLETALGKVAEHIHGGEIAGFTDEGVVREKLSDVLASPQQVEAVLAVARDTAGFLVARGEGVYGFLHRSLQEYFAACWLVAEPRQAASRLSAYALDPTWREPVALALGLLSQPAQSRHLATVCQAILAVPDVTGAFLPQKEFLLVAGWAECESLPSGVQPQVWQVTTNLIDLYAQYEGRGKSPVLRKRIQRAFASLYQSVACNMVEPVLLEALLSPMFEKRWAVADLIIETQWDTPAVAETLVSAWQTYDSPAGSLLAALSGLQRRHANYFQARFLPFRAVMEQNPDLWSRVMAHPGWSAVVQALYALPEMVETSETIYRDSPLTAQLLPWLQADPIAEPLSVLEEVWRELAAQPETTQGRDAALALTVLGDKGWVEAFTVQAGEAMSLWRHRLASLIGIFALSLSRSLVLSRDLSFDLDLARDLARDFARAFDIDRALARALDIARDIARDRALDLVLDRDRAFDHDRARARAFDLTHHRDRAFDRDRALPLAIHRAIIHRATLREISGLLEQVQERWGEEEEIQRVLTQARSTLSQMMIGEDPVAVIQSFSHLLRQRLQRKEEPSSLPNWVLTEDALPELVDALRSADDERREQARTRLQEERAVTSLTPQIVRMMAMLAGKHNDDPRVGTQLEWALNRLEHNEPAWLQTWINEVAEETSTESPAERIVSNIHQLTDDCFQVILAALPHPSQRVNLTLLQSLSWLARWDRLPQSSRRKAVNTFLAWLTEEEDDKVRLALFKLMGCWPQGEETPDVLRKLQVCLPQTTSDAEHAALYMALVRQGAKSEEARASVERVLREVLPKPGAAAALARLWAQSDQAWSSFAYPETVSLTMQLQALVTAGIDNDVWDDGSTIFSKKSHHNELVEAARDVVLDNSQALMPVLWQRYEQALNENWQARRMALAVLAACLERIPGTVQDVVGSRLEALLVQGVKDTDSHNSRRFALTALSYLRAVTPAVASLLLAGCQDVDIVRDNTIKAASSPSNGF